MRHAASFVILLLVLLASTAFAQTEPAAKPAGERKRLVYAVKHAPALSLATVIGDHFNDDPGAAVRVVPESVSNTLLISAAPAAMEEVLAVLRQLDKAPAMITIEVLVVELDSTPPPEPAERRPAAKT